MEQESERIERHIENRRDQLGDTLNELESRVKNTFDWRSQFDRNPWLVLGVAFGTGVAVSAMMGRRSGYSSSYSSSSSFGNGAMSKMSENWNRMQGALIAAASRRLEGFLGEVMPEFREELDRTQHQGGMHQQEYRPGEGQFRQENYQPTV